MKAPSGNIVAEILSDTTIAKELMTQVITGGKIDNGEKVNIDGGKYTVEKIGFFTSSKFKK